MTPAAAATCIGGEPGNILDRNSVFSVAAMVPIMRPPKLVAKLPPVPRRCIGKTRGRNSLRKLNWATVSKPQKNIAIAKIDVIRVHEAEIGHGKQDDPGDQEQPNQRPARHEQQAAPPAGFARRGRPVPARAECRRAVEDWAACPGLVSSLQFRFRFGPFRVPSVVS